MQFVIFKGACSLGAIYIYEIFIHHELAFVSLIVYINYVMYIHTSSKQLNEIFWLYFENIEWFKKDMIPSTNQKYDYRPHHISNLI